MKGQKLFHSIIRIKMYWSDVSTEKTFLMRNFIENFFNLILNKK